ncbi:hypothetical protein AMECASPLE_008684, partial [Ameca splendens]
MRQCVHPLPQQLARLASFQLTGWLRLHLFGFTALRFMLTRLLGNRSYTEHESAEHSLISNQLCVLKSDWSMDPITVFKDRDQCEHKGIQQQTPTMSPTSCLSMKSDWSMDLITVFKEGHQSVQNQIQQQTPTMSPTSCLSMKSDWSMDLITVFKEGHQFVANSEQQTSEVLGVQSFPHSETDLDSIFKALEENILSFVKTELKKFQNILRPDYHEWLKNQAQNEDVWDGDAEDQGMTSGDSFMKLTLNFLKNMKQKRLADHLHS